MASLAVNTRLNMPKYRSMAQSPRPQADGVGGPPRRNFADEPPTPELTIETIPAVLCMIE